MHPVVIKGQQRGYSPTCDDDLVNYQTLRVGAERRKWYCTLFISIHGNVLVMNYATVQIECYGSKGEYQLE